MERERATERNKCGWESASHSHFTSLHIAVTANLGHISTIRSFSGSQSIAKPTARQLITYTLHSTHQPSSATELTLYRIKASRIRTLIDKALLPFRLSCLPSKTCLATPSPSHHLTCGLPILRRVPVRQARTEFLVHKL